MTHYRIKGLDPEPFRPLFGLSDTDLALQCVVRVVVNAKPGAPCRVTLIDAEPGERVLLVNHEYQSADTPYRGRHAIFVREGVREAALFEDEIPASLSCRVISVRAYDSFDMMIEAELIDGAALEQEIGRMFMRSDVAYLHAHNAKRGCFAARIDRS